MVQFEGVESLTRMFVLVSGELVGIIVGGLLLGLMTRLILGRIGLIPAMRDHPERLAGLRRRIRYVLISACLGLCLGALGLNGYLVFQRTDPYVQTTEWINAIPPDFWLKLALSLAKVIGLVIAGRMVINMLVRLLNSLMGKAKAFEGIRANDESIEVFFSSLTAILSNCIKFLVVIAAAALLSLPGPVAAYLLAALYIYLFFTIGLLVVKAVAAIVDSLDALSKKYSSPDNWLRHYEKLSILIPLFRRCLEYVIYVTVATLVILQLSFIERFAVIGPRLTKVIGIFFISRVIIEIGNILIDRFQQEQKNLTEKERKQRLTLIPLMKSAMKYVVYFTAILLALNAMNFNPAPLLAGAGIIGIVIGLGAQPLINDLVSGLFILFESLYLVGDYIETGQGRGVVESIDIRTTRLRDPGGQQHILRNGQIGDIINFSKRYTFAEVEVGVAYDTDLDLAYTVLAEVGRKIREVNQDVLEDMKVLGLQNFGESELLLRTITRVKPGCHQQVARDLRKLIKEAFDGQGIEIPYARRVLIFKTETEENPLKDNTSSTLSDRMR
ncbi:mechanosensitive ion channel family protein [Pontiella agarivorans]|uniref:Mechanosensitive ion channel family protein n=1 Tax=Pontiella agarivorans TaxID=3038953 RepID=A0ABU5MVK8_9BACT|nr:mechanosensitive ion channel family protein [Pontiella agarivorans]MDZ8118244.1 mechanosensitive ion channel family protein [Pontiella agarivorans]